MRWCDSDSDSITKQFSGRGVMRFNSVDECHAKCWTPSPESLNRDVLNGRFEALNCPFLCVGRVALLSPPEPEQNGDAVDDPDRGDNSEG